MCTGRPRRVGLAACAIVLTGCAAAPTTGPVPAALPAAVAPAPSDTPPAPSPSPAAPSPSSTVPSPGPVTPLPVARPLRLVVPSIGVRTALVDLGLRADGSLEVPAGAFPAGWYTGAPTPGELGPAVIAGHVDLDGRAGVFADLARLAPGAEVVVDRQDGTRARFRVTRVDRVGKDAFPTAAVYGDLDHAGLRLITCGGRFSERAGSYVDNVIAYAELVGTA